VSGVKPQDVSKVEASSRSGEEISNGTSNRVRYIVRNAAHNAAPILTRTQICNEAFLKADASDIKPLVLHRLRSFKWGSWCPFWIGSCYGR
jgi:hypothetical protein